MDSSSLLELPHTPNCLVCGRGNPHGLKLSLHVDPKNGEVRTTYTPTADHIGFEGVVHGGILATVLDEAMVWAATWGYKRFCLCAEMTVRYKLPVEIGRPVTVIARVDQARPRLTTTSGQIFDAAGRLLAEGTAKYVPLSAGHNDQMVATLVEESGTCETAAALRSAADGFR
jgi:uncharacterized protein (TIGR00369 family)